MKPKYLDYILSITCITLKMVSVQWTRSMDDVFENAFIERVERTLTSWKKHKPLAFNERVERTLTSWKNWKKVIYYYLQFLSISYLLYRYPILFIPYPLIFRTISNIITCAAFSLCSCIDFSLLSLASFIDQFLISFLLPVHFSFLSASLRP